MENNNKNSRRKFLDKGLKLGFITAISGIGLSKIISKSSANTPNNSNDKMELMTTDGHLVEIDS